MTDGRKQRSLFGRTAVITGATGAAGPAVARALRDAGADLALVGTSMERLAAAATTAGLRRHEWTGHVGDLRTEEAARAVIDDVGRNGQRSIDILVHLIGGYAGGSSLVEVDPGDVSAMLDQHLWTTFHITRAALPLMTDRGWGRIIAISTPFATAPLPRATPYAVGKAAMEALLGTLARETSGTGVTVNTLLVKRIDAEHARLREPWTTPEEIGAAVAFLCSDEAGSIHGARIPLYPTG